MMCCGRPKSVVRVVFWISTNTEILLNNVPCVYRALLILLCRQIFYDISDQLSSSLIRFSGENILNFVTEYNGISIARLEIANGLNLNR